jgi:GNAT superfamily N-acetyltransferase
MQQASVTILPAHTTDCGRLTEIARAAKAYWGYPSAWLEEWRDILTVSPDLVDRATVFKAVIDEDVVGFYALTDDSDTVELDHMWVEPRAIGRGVGRRLFEHAVQIARQLGAARIIVESDPNAAEFYEHMGCARVGERHGTVGGSARTLPVLELALDAMRL